MLKPLQGIVLGSLLLAVGFMVLNPTPTHAAGENISLTLTPVSKSYDVDAGSVTRDSIKIINDGKVAYTFSVYAKPYFVSDNDYTADFTVNKTNSDIHKWLKFEKSKYTIQPNETITIPYTMTVPSGSAPGAHYGVIFAEADPRDKELQGQTGVVTSQRVGTLMYATVKGQYRMGGAVESLSIPFFQFNPPLKGRVGINNTGNADFMAKATMTVQDVFGSTKYTQQNEYRVLAETTRDIRFEWKTLPRFGVYKVTITTDFLDEKQHKSSYVLMAPAWSYLIGVLVILAGITYFTQRRR